MLLRHVQPLMDSMRMQIYKNKSWSNTPSMDMLNSPGEFNIQ